MAKHAFKIKIRIVENKKPYSRYHSLLSLNYKDLRKLCGNDNNSFIEHLTENSSLPRERNP